MNKDFYAGILFHNTPKYHELNQYINDSVDAYELILGQYAKEPDAIEDIKQFGKPLILHTNVLSPCSYNGTADSIISKVENRVKISDALWVGDHMCFSKIQGIDTGTLMPPFFMEEEVDFYSKNINLIQEQLSCPLAIENVVMHYNPIGNLSPGEFFHKITEKTGVGLILSLENIAQSAFYSKLDPYEFIDSLPLEKVVQIHCSLGNIEEQRENSYYYEKQLHHFEILEYLSKKEEFQPRALMWELETEVPSLPEVEYLKEKLNWARELFSKQLIK